MLLQLLQKVDTPDIKAAALSPDSYHSRQQYHLWIIISNQITLWGKKGLYFHIAVDTAWLFIVYMDLVIVVLPIYSLLQCGSERIISVMLVSGSPPPTITCLELTGSSLSWCRFNLFAVIQWLIFFLSNFFLSSLRTAADRMVMATAGEGHSRRCAPR